MPRTKQIEAKRKEAASRSWHEAQQLIERRQSAYQNLVQRAPVLLLTNGLGQFLAYLTARGGGDPSKPEELLRRQLCSWVLSQMGRRSDSDLLDLLTRRWNSRTLRKATLVAVDFLTELRGSLE